MRLVVLLSFFLTSCVLAQTDRLTIHSDILQDDFTLQLQLPDTYHHSDTVNYPVLVVLDGTTQFEHIAANVSFLSTFAIVPEMIVVGVSANDRLRYFTPTAVDKFKGRSGEALRYKQFLEQELLTQLADKYRTADYQLISGHSLSGLFSSYIAMSPDTVFDAAISISPSLWWDDNWLVLQSPQWLAAKRVKPMRWFLSMANEPDDMASAFALQIKQLQTQKPTNNANAKLYWSYQQFSHETHDSTPLTGNIAALKSLFSDWNAVPEIAVMSLSDLKAFYLNKSAEFGYVFSLSAHQYNVYGLKAAYEQQTAWGVEILEEGVAKFAHSEILWDSLATAYDLADMPKKARQASDKAVVLAKKHDSIFLSDILAQARRLAKTAAKS